MRTAFAALAMMIPVLSMADQPATSPTAPSAAMKTIADLRAENRQLRERLAAMERELSALKAQLPAPAAKLAVMMPQAKAEATMRADGWKLDKEDADDVAGSVTQLWIKQDGDFELRRELLFASRGTKEFKLWEGPKDSKRRNRR